MPARDMAKAKADLAKMPDVRLEIMDLLDPGSIDAFAEQFLRSFGAVGHGYCGPKMVLVSDVRRDLPKMAKGRTKLLGHVWVLDRELSRNRTRMLVDRPPQAIGNSPFAPSVAPKSSHCSNSTDRDAADARLVSERFFRVLLDLGGSIVSPSDGRGDARVPAAAGLNPAAYRSATITACPAAVSDAVRASALEKLRASGWA